MTTSDGNAQPIPSKQGVVELVRVINRATHVSPTDRNREKEFVVRNNSNEEKTYIFLPLVEFRLNLEVYDEDGIKLNYFPNNEVNNLLDTLKETNKEAYESIEERFGGIKYKLLIQLPENRPIEPGEFRTIKITFGQSEAVQYHRIFNSPILTGWWNHWKRKFFTIPSFVARAEKSTNQTHSELFVVEGPREYATVAERSEEHADREGFYENGYGKDTGILSTRLPPATDSDYTWELTYELIPDRRGLMRLLAGFWGVSFLTALSLCILQVLHFMGCISLTQTIFDTTFETIGQTFSAGTLSGIVGVLYGVRSEWAERYRLLCLVPLLLHIVSWTLWHLIP